jgi:DNA-binding transcriptional LysR family regulator
MVGIDAFRASKRPRRLRMELRPTEVHFGTAAESLGIAQPALAQQIRALQRDIGVELLPPDEKSVKLTVAGGVTLNQATL